MGWVGLEETSKVLFFQPSAVGRDTSTVPGCSLNVSKGWKFHQQHFHTSLCPIPENTFPPAPQIAVKRIPARAWAATPPSPTLAWPSSPSSGCPRGTTGTGSWRCVQPLGASSSRGSWRYSFQMDLGNPWVKTKMFPLRTSKWGFLI